MSIIHEALKKAAFIKKASETAKVQKEGQIIDSNNKVTSINQETQPTLSKKPTKKRAVLILPITIGLMAILITASIFLLNNYLLPKRPKVGPKKVLPLSTDKSPQKRGSLDSFTLTGIVYDKEPMAVINGSVYTEGEYVSGAKITEITRQRVLLEKGGEQIELVVKK